MQCKQDIMGIFIKGLTCFMLPRGIRKHCWNVASLPVREFSFTPQDGAHTDTTSSLMQYLGYPILDDGVKKYRRIIIKAK